MTDMLVQALNRCPEPRHLSGVTGAATISTPGLREFRVNFRQMFGQSHVYLIDGEPGVGKTYGVRTALTELDLPTFWVDMSDTPRGKETTSRVFQAVSGRRPPRYLTDFELQEETVDALNDRTAVLAIDEAQNLTVSAIRALRYLSDRPTSRLVVTLIGPGVFNTVRRVPEFDSRVSRRTHVKGLRGAKGLDLIRELHPLLAATKEDVVVHLAEVARGNLRAWTRIVEVAQSLNISPTRGLQMNDAKLIVRQVAG